MKAVISKADGKEREYSDQMANFLVSTGRASWPVQKKEEKKVVETKEEKINTEKKVEKKKPITKKNLNR